MKKASVTTRNSVGMATSSRRPMKRSMRAATFPPRRIDVKPDPGRLPRERPMSQFRRVTDQLSVSPQISLADVDEAARQGFRLIVNNRPDGEEPAQVPSREIEAAAVAAGLGYVHIPVHGGPTAQQVET